MLEKNNITLILHKKKKIKVKISQLIFLTGSTYITFFFLIGYPLHTNPSSFVGLNYGRKTHPNSFNADTSLKLDSNSGLWLSYKRLVLSHLSALGCSTYI